MSGPTATPRGLIDAFVTQHYTRLQQISRKFVRPHQESDDLLSYAVEELYSGRDSVERAALNGHDDLFAWFTRVVKTAALSPRSSIGSWARKHPDQPLRHHQDSDDASEPVETVFDLQPEIEEAPVSAYAAELLQKGLSADQVAKLVALQACQHCLPPHMQRLYSLYFEEGMSIRAVAKRVKLPPTSVFIQVELLRERIRECVASNPTPLL